MKHLDQSAYRWWLAADATVQALEKRRADADRNYRSTLKAEFERERWLLDDALSHAREIRRRRKKELDQVRAKENV